MQTLLSRLFFHLTPLENNAMSRPRTTLAVCTALALFGSVAVQAQWSTDPAASLIVADVDNGTTQPKMAPTPDGGFYVSWFDNIGNGFDIRLQRLDANGNALWAHNGILVADRGYSSTYDYGLTVDADGNAYLSFNCCENGAADEHIAVSKVRPDGSLAWGASGIDVSTADEGIYNAYVSPAEGDKVVVAWSSEGGVRVQKLDADGNAQWAADGVLIDQPNGVKLLGGLQVGVDGDVIVSWNNQPTFSTRILTAQKLAGSNGAALWNNGTGVRVFGQGNLQAGYYPPFLADGAGGGVFWDYDFSGGSWVSRVQHLDADGSPLLGANGVLGTTDTTQDHVGTSATYDPASGDIYLVWNDSYVENLQDYDGVSAQRIDASGNRAWGDTGKVLAAPMNSTDGTHAISQLVALPAPGGFVASWVTGAIPAADQPITAAMVDAAGEFVWAKPRVAIKTQGYTGRTVGAISTHGFAAYTWQDGDDGAGLSTIRAQNLNFDGTLGPADTDTVFKDGFDGA